MFVAAVRRVVIRFLKENRINKADSHEPRDGDLTIVGCFHSLEFFISANITYLRFVLIPDPHDFSRHDFLAGILAHFFVSDGNAPWLMFSRLRIA